MYAFSSASAIPCSLFSASESVFGFSLGKVRRTG